VLRRLYGHQSAQPQVDNPGNDGACKQFSGEGPSPQGYGDNADENGHHSRMHEENQKKVED
jgi:hypothetical protein